MSEGKPGRTRTASECQYTDLDTDEQCREEPTVKVRFPYGNPAKTTYAYCRYHADVAMRAFDGIEA